MGAVNTNSISLAYTEETSLGVLPTNAIAEYLEPNGVSDYGANISTTARNPISKDRQNKKGTITDLSSTVSVDQDTTVSSFMAFIEGAMYGTWARKPHWFKGEIAATEGVDAGFTLTDPMPGIPIPGTILFCRGFVNGGNNGLKIVAAGSTASLIKVENDSTLVDEVAGDGASVYVVGFQGESGAISVNAQGNLVNDASFSWNDLGLEIGQGILIGGLGASVSFDNKDNSGLVRVREITDGLLVVDKRNQAFASDAGTGKTIQIFIGWFLRNVSVDDPRFAERSYAFELAYPGLGDNNTDAYEYSLGNLINTWELSLPLNDKSGLTITTFGKDVEPITETRRTWDFRKPLFTEAFSTPNDFLRLRMQNVDETGLTTYFTEATLTINNNAGGENVLGKLGPAFVNYGNFDVSLATTAVFTSKELTSKIRNNCTVTCDFCIYNNDGGVYIDIPSMTLGDGARDFPVNEKVKISLASAAFGDAALGYTISHTFFPYMPSEKAEVC